MGCEDRWYTEIRQEGRVKPCAGCTRSAAIAERRTGDEPASSQPVRRPYVLLIDTSPDSTLLIQSKVLDYFPKQGKEDKNKDKSTEGTVGLRLTIPDQIRTKKPKQSRIPNHNFKVHDFQMYIRLLNEDNQRIHEITGLSSELEPSCVSVEDVHDQIREFPELQDLLYGGDIRCPVVLVEATFDLPSQECLVAGKELCIAQCVKTSRELKSGYVWKTRTSIFAPGAKVLAGEESMESFNANKTVHEIKFRSAYWADLFTHYGSQLHTKPDAPRKSGVSADKHRQVRDHLRGIRAVQEILSHPKTGNGSGTPERHMMICWTFKQAHPGEAGVTKWQEIVIPPTLPSQSHIYPSPSASFTPDEGTEDGYNMSFDLYNNMPYIEGMHHHQAGDPTDSDALRSPERLTAMPYFGANIWPPIVPSQALIPRSYDIPSYNASQHPVVQELYDEPDYLAVGFGMTPPNSALVASFAQSFDTSAASDESQSPPEPSDESQAAQYSQGTGYSQASSGQYAEHVDDSLGGQTMHVYVPQAQYADLPLNTSFMYDQQLQDFSSFSRVLEDDHTVGGLEYHFDQSTVPILASQPVHVDDGGDNVNRRGSLSHLRLTAAFDPSFFSPIIPEAPQILPLSSGVTHPTVMPHLLPRALEHGEE